MLYQCKKNHVHESMVDAAKCAIVGIVTDGDACLIFTTPSAEGVPMPAPTRDQPASPLPWETIWNDPSGVTDADGSTIIGLHLLRHADAAYLVHAANHYHGLVAALKRLVAAVTDAGERGCITVTHYPLLDAERAARAALAQAGEV